MERIGTILWDIDGTLLDFKAAQAAALHRTFAHYALGPCSEEMLRDYDAINDGFWKALERGEVDRPTLLEARFRVFFRRYRLPEALVGDFGRTYEERLGDTALPMPHARETLLACRGAGLRQYGATNGTKAAQLRKLRASGLGELLDGVFISEDLGWEKPDRRFFEAVFRALGTAAASTFLLVGDSLSSDILGGRNAGIRTCLYRHPGPAAENTGAPVAAAGGKAQAADGPRPDHVIFDLAELPALLGISG